ncbi:Uncharacterised protein [BD1-7 clade bacterium]|uniref:Uncharacterized protein n=1 Tax=BD1-7 clade bacterium TaxID=2029982 RepID=A0A5S9QTD5_9GAMM|nr:Uncharacterised protein [BD1-7 clade bacterium]CAA0122595.1 Uncharacterised protein [BD1-7 clade bacterium]
MANFESKSDLAFKATMAGYFLQLVIVVLSTTVLVPTHKSPNLVICVLSLIPLLILLPWLIKRNIRAHIWLCFIVLGYFLPAVLHAFIPQYGWLPYVEVANLIYLFIVAMLFARWEQKRYQISVTR